MGCGSSINETEVNEPKQTLSEQQIKQLSDSNGRFLSDRKIPDPKDIHADRPIEQENHQPALMMAEQQSEEKSIPSSKIYLFGQSATERKIIEFCPSGPSIEILLSRTNNPPPVKYQPPEVILEESQQFCSSYLFCSNSHPPYNYMFATFIKNSVIFLCGGVNYNFDNVSNEAFLYNIKQEQQFTPSRSSSTKKKQRSIGNNLMGTKFEKLALMKHRRYSHMGVFCKFGKLDYIYVMGGRNEKDVVLKSCERYSFQQQKWAQIADMNYPRSTGFTFIANQKIYAFGGYTDESKRSKKIERYNPAFDSWQILNVQLHRGIETGLLLPCPQRNDLLLVGGNVEFGALKSVIRINFENETYCWDSDMKKERLLQKGISLLDQNLAYIFGGDFDDTIEKYSYKDKSWKIVTNFNYGDCISPDDINAFTVAQDTIELAFDSSSIKSEAKDVSHDAVQGNSKFIFGSDDYPCIYQLNTSKWVLKKRNVPMAMRLRSLLTSTKIKEGKIFIGGGIDSYEQKASRAAFIYYPGTNKAIQIAKMKRKKYQFAACTSQNFVYVFGGKSGKEGEALAECQKYDINEDKWIEVGDMPRQRARAKAICTPDGKKIVIIGGYSFLSTISQIDILDLQTDTFWTLNNIIPVPLEIKSAFIYQSKRTDLPLNQRVKTEEQFQFLEQQKPSSQNQEEQKPQPVELSEKKQEEGQPSELESELYDLLIFNYNSYLKQHDTVSLTTHLNGQQKIFNNKINMKLHPFSMSFQVQKEEKEDPVYFFISGKGIFKWKPGDTQMGSQIVINQIHLLQMPLQKFSIA